MHISGTKYRNRIENDSFIGHPTLMTTNPYRNRIENDSFIGHPTLMTTNTRCTQQTQADSGTTLFFTKKK